MWPWLPLALGATGLAVAFGLGAARPRVIATGPRAWVLRWGHALTWVFLAICFAVLALDAHPPIDAGTFALIGLGWYLAFMATLVDSRRR